MHFAYSCVNPCEIVKTKEPNVAFIFTASTFNNLTLLSLRSFSVTDTQLYIQMSVSVGLVHYRRVVHHNLEMRAVFALQTLPNCPRLWFHLPSISILYLSKEYWNETQVNPANHDVSFAKGRMIYRHAFEMECLSLRKSKLPVQFPVPIFLILWLNCFSSRRKSMKKSPSKTTTKKKTGFI